ncbi:MAG: beta-glycosidase [Bacteroides sp.]|nr:beta-glycosidase [Bacteroides sp.]
MSNDFLSALILSASMLPMPFASFAGEVRDTIILSGEWDYWLHGAPTAVKTEGTLTLPGTLDTNGIGIPVEKSHDTSRLSRRVSFTGDVTYSKEVEIPSDWEGKDIELYIERSRPSIVMVDGEISGSSSLLSSAQKFNLSKVLTPGSHKIEVTINNGDSIPRAIRNNSHACTESTQTNWNGMIGDIHLEARNPIHIASANAFPKTDKSGYEIKIRLSKPSEDRLSIVAAEGNSIQIKSVVFPGDSTASIFLPMPYNHDKWSEWNPVTDTLSLTLSDHRKGVIDRKNIITGYRKFSSSEGKFTINGDPVFLRGRHDACVFPITAHVPMDIETWRDYFSTLKQYGLNHVRFHSWCPPEACFQAADEAGVYLQPELPIWGELDNSLTSLLSFLHKDMEGIIEQYSSHPSFVMFAIGNELWGDIGLMNNFIDDAREMNPNLLATPGSNIYLGMNGHIEGEDYLVTCRVGDGPGFSTHARASFSFADADNGGLINSTYPNSEMNFSNSISRSPVPVIGHETGQYQFYPDFSVIQKFSNSVLRPDNIEEFENRAREAGHLRKNTDFFQASGKWAAKLYRADMEMNLRTPGMGGFQLLDIQDYPGQGTALVGILDPFMDSKGLITPQEWRQSCNEITLLAEMPRFCFTSGDTVTVKVKTANFSNKSLSGSTLTWALTNNDKKRTFNKGSLQLPEGKGLLDIGEINITFPKVKQPQHIILSLSSSTPEEQVSNEYDVWVFPTEKKWVKNVTVTRDIDEAFVKLRKGKNVILYPDTARVKDAVLGPLFQTDYWNYRMFYNICRNMEKTPSPGTMGLLIDDKHPALKNYPTSNHTDWQWFPVISNSYPLIIDRLPKDFDPIVEVIDNVERAYRVALMLECNVGKGKLMIINADMGKASEYPEGEWLLQSVMEYMGSKECKPRLTLSEEQLLNLLTKPSAARTIKELTNPSEAMGL